MFFIEFRDDFYNLSDKTIGLLSLVKITIRDGFTILRCDDADVFLKLLRQNDLPNVYNIDISDNDFDLDIFYDILVSFQMNHQPKYKLLCGKLVSIYMFQRDKKIYTNISRLYSLLRIAIGMNLKHYNDFVNTISSRHLNYIDADSTLTLVMQKYDTCQAEELTKHCLFTLLIPETYSSTNVHDVIGKFRNKNEMLLWKLKHGGISYKEYIFPDGE